ISAKAAVQVWQDQKRSGPGLLRRFLTPDEGGTDPGKPVSRRGLFAGSLVPISEMSSYLFDPNKFPPESWFGKRVREGLTGPFLVAVLEPHGPRDELLRGKQMSQAAQQLKQTQDTCRQAIHRLKQEKTTVEREFQPWLKNAFTLDAEQ